MLQRLDDGTLFVTTRYPIAPRCGICQATYPVPAALCDGPVAVKCPSCQRDDVVMFLVEAKCLFPKDMPIAGLPQEGV